jgi:large subunit ribosomal protein L22
MEVRAITKNVRLSARKARNLVRMIQGLAVKEALQITEVSEKKSAFEIGKTLKSAIANAENNHKLSADGLRVKEAVVSEGMSLRRSWARSRGSASPIKKRFCHVKIVLTDGAEA